MRLSIMTLSSFKWNRMSFEFSHNIERVTEKVYILHGRRDTQHNDAQHNDIQHSNK
jgi:hypothetical protein